ncbi:MAG TPA: hypothetical protein VLJ86_19870 [Ramlibacter sp.]|nr:hypothetical protein [Ramlibacter sp.]
MENVDPSYSTLHFIVRHGQRLAQAVALGTVLTGVLLAWATGALWSLPIAVAAGGLALLIMRSYAELVRVIVDMLLPK